ncbi:MAG: hypothetical protein DRJ40_02950 [Thermoprotei archaeon]|nr:MAG: hypothetical protein DRJ40_02950 [Thermoprotei archaeon]
MVIVIDASALAKYILGEEQWETVAQYLEQERVLTLGMALVEVLNVVRKAVHIHKLLSRDVAREKYLALKKLVENEVIEVENEVKYLEKAFNLALSTGITVYDALYIVQAMEHKTQLLTSDRGQAEVAKNLGVTAVIV